MAQEDYTAIRVTDDAKAVAKESKKDSETWNEFIQRCAENPPEVREFVDAESIAEDRQEQLEEVVYSACGGTALEEHIGELAEIIEQLPERTANELEGRMR